MSSDIEEDSDYLIEEINPVNVPEKELHLFQETRPLQFVGVVCETEDGSSKQKNIENKADLMEKFISGKSELPNFYTELESEEGAEDDEDNEQDDRLSTLDYTKEMNSTRSGSSKQRTKKRTVLNPALQGLMGQANLSYARGKTSIAEKICLEIIRQNPLAPEPFITLAEIYESNDEEKYLNFLTIAAHLNRHDRDQWIRIAEIHIARGNYHRARTYYARAIKALPKDHDLRLRKGHILEKMGETSAAMLTYLKMIHLFPNDCAEQCLDTAKKVSRYYHNLKKNILALNAMSSAYEKCAHIFTVEDLNIYMELLILNKQFEEVLKVARQFSVIEITMEEDNHFETITDCTIPDNLVADIRAKLVISLINIKTLHLVDYFIQNIHEHISVVGNRLDIYVDIAEAFIHMNKYIEVISLLEPITNEKLIECPAFIWLKHADCLKQLNHHEDAIQSYYRVIQLAPYCYEAKFNLAALLKQSGRLSDAVKALEQSDENKDEPLNARLLYERCILLHEIGDIEQFLEVGITLLGRHSIILRNREEMIAVSNGGNVYNVEGIKIVLQMRNITEDTEKMLQVCNKMPVEKTDLLLQDEYKLFLNLVQCGFDYKKYSTIERMCFAMVTTKRFALYNVDLERIIAFACYFNNDCNIAFSYLRENLTKHLSRTSFWNFFGLLIQKSHDLRYHRYLNRLLQRYPSARKMNIFLAHYHMHCSSYKSALNFYVPALRESKDPLIALCISIIFNHVSIQRKVMRKIAAVAQAITFAQTYADLRKALANGEEDSMEFNYIQQEICYNIGRIYHQSGFTYLAKDYYKRGLSIARNRVLKSEIDEKMENCLGLTYEIAFNLHLIYRASGNMQKARQYLYEYCVV